MPKWLDDSPSVDFTPEKELLAEIEAWALASGWDVSDGSGLNGDFRLRTDVLIEKPYSGQHLRLSVLPKVRRGPATIRIDASTHRIFELIYQPRTQRWRVETASVPLSDDLHSSGWPWLTDLAFRP